MVKRTVVLFTLKVREKRYFEGCRHEVDAYDEEAFRLMFKPFGKPRTIIEIGCGSGAWTKHLASKGAYVIGVDISSLLIKELHRKLGNSNCEATVGDAEFLPFGNNVADDCFFGFSLHHVPNIVQSIGEAVRCLRKGGRLLMIEPNKLNFAMAFESQIVSLLKMVNRAGLTSPGERPLNANEIRRMLNKLGFHCKILPSYAALRQRSRTPRLSLASRIYSLALRLAARVFPGFFGATDFILIAMLPEDE